MSNVTKYKVSIFGESYFLVSDESQEHVNAAALLVDSCMREIAEKSQITESKRIAVLVALQLASKALTSMDIVDRQQQKSDRLLALMDKELSHFSPL
ncbi:cell division protein ZapA [Candidatus Dependentiae bacterium]|nr:cell division protein ZapA [Candidatus Dependentiae bacterium]